MRWAFVRSSLGSFSLVFIRKAHLTSRYPFAVHLHSSRSFRSFYGLTIQLLLKLNWFNFAGIGARSHRRSRFGLASLRWTSALFAILHVRLESFNLQCCLEEFVLLLNDQICISQYFFGIGVGTCEWMRAQSSIKSSCFHYCSVDGVSRWRCAFSTALARSLRVRVHRNGALQTPVRRNTFKLHFNEVISAFASAWVRKREAAPPKQRETIGCGPRWRRMEPGNGNRWV